MAAVSGPLNGQALNHQKNMEGSYDTWEYARPKSQERTKPSFSKPFSVNNPPFLERKFDPSLQNTVQYNITGSVEHSHLIQSGFDEQTFTAGPLNISKVISNTNTNHLSPHNAVGLRPALSDISRSGSEPDSLLDLYGRPRSRVEVGDNMDRPDANTSLYPDEEDPERSRWIHRDKLALIESHEMQEAGIRLSRLAGSNSKSNSLAEHSSHKGQRDRGKDLHNAEEDGQHQPQPSSLPEQDSEGDNTIQFDLRTPEEIATEPSSIHNSPPVYRHGLRSSSSRIPLPKSSPLPIPQEHIVRNTPLTRNRGASGNWNGGDEDGITNNKTRSRSHSVGSQVLLDEGEQHLTSDHAISVVGQDSPSASPSKRAGNKISQAPSVGARKASNALRNVSESQKAPRTASSTYRSSPGQRPKSRSGLETRPATAINRPEGDPPWLATMYKPDPRLPPDQQLLPTHAKRLEQKKNGIPVPTPDEDINPITVHPQEESQPSNPGDDVLKQEGDEIEPAWPLKVSSTKDNGSPGLSGTEHGGYSTIPKVQNIPSIGAATSPKAVQPPKPEDEAPKKKGCGCCTIM